ncbi:MAG: glycerophosphodiester phosphodiesterase family protein [Pseudomonadales bacterium]
MPQACPEFDQPFVVIGHRGAAGHEPENTLRSFARAVEMGAHAIELDVFLLEGELVVIHDDSLERTTNGTGKLAEHTLSAVRSLDAGAGERVPLLCEVLFAIDGAVGINVELKGEGTGARLVAYLKEHDHDGAGILASSFRHAELAAHREAGGSCPLGLLFGRSAEGLFERAEALDPYAVHLSVRLATSALVDRIHERGTRVFVYTVNELDVLKRMRDAGVDGVFSDYPDRILSALR